MPQCFYCPCDYIDPVKCEKCIKKEKEVNKEIIKRTKKFEDLRRKKPSSQS